MQESHVGRGGGGGGGGDSVSKLAQPGSEATSGCWFQNIILCFLFDCRNKSNLEGLLWKTMIK